MIVVFLSVRSATFYYGSGILLGVGVSLLLAVFLLHRLVPSVSNLVFLFPFEPTPNWHSS